MNKKLIALAVAGACVAPAAMAQTANPITLYGRAMVSFDSIEAKGGTTPIPRKNRVADHNSFVGVRGTEDLGGGLKAFFQAEWAFAYDENRTTSAQAVPTPTPGSINNTPFSGRNSAVGLQGGWGSILLGRWDAPMKVTQTAVDPFGNNQMGDIAGVALRQGTFNNRITNNVQYWSPNWAGFTLRLSYGANEGKGFQVRNTTVTVPTPNITVTSLQQTNINAENYGGSLAYTMGNFYAAYAYEEHKDSVGQTPTAGTKERGNAVAASYRFGAFKLDGQYGEYTRTGTSKQKSFLAGLEWFIGNHQLAYTYMKSEDGGATGSAQPKCDKNSVGYWYHFSKRTMLFVEYAKVDNEVGALCDLGTTNVGGGPNPSLQAGQDPVGLGIGVRHLF